MVDDELLPKNHPLQLYLEELELTEDVTLIDPEPEPRANSWKFTLSRQFQQCVTKMSSVIHPWAFGFPELCKQRILAEASDFVDGDDAATMRYVYNAQCTDVNGVTSLLFLLSLGIILPVGLVMADTSIGMTFLGCVLLVPGLFVLLCAVSLYTIHHLLARCSTQSRQIHAPLKMCLSFLQEFDRHSSFGASRLNLMCNQTAWSFPTLQRHLGQCLRFYNEKLIYLSEWLNDVIMCSSGEFTFGLTSAELDPLKDRVSSNQLTFILRELKMLREVALLLEADLIGKVIGLICVAPVQSICSWVRLVFLLRCLSRSLNDLKEPLNRLDRLKEYVQNGGSDSEALDSSTVDSPEINVCPSLRPDTRLTRTILMHLLLAVKSTRHLDELIKQRDEAADEVPDSWMSTVDHIRCQLNMCTDSVDALKRLLWPDIADSDATESTEPATQQPDFAFKSLEGETARTTLKAQDIDPEDDVLEDVAIGEESDAEEGLKTVADDVDGGDSNPIIPLPPSVLRELRNALTYRRLTMEEREERALRKRKRTDQVAMSATTPVTASSGTLLEMKPSTIPPPPPLFLDEPFKNGSISSGPAASVTMLSDATPDGDLALESFFSQLSPDTAPAPSVQIQKQLMRRCSWQARSAVTKRLNQFRRANSRPTSATVEEQGEGEKFENGVDPAPPPRPTIPSHLNGLTRIPLPGMVPLPFQGSRTPGAHPFLRPFRPDNSLASALLAQRRKAGYAEEDSFTAVGTGEEKLPERPPPPKEEVCVTNGDVPS